MPSHYADPHPCPSRGLHAADSGQRSPSGSQYSDDDKVFPFGKDTTSRSRKSWPLSPPVQSPRAVINYLQNLLRDQYVAGFPILKELVQNADDAGASRLLLTMHGGWMDASSTLLKHPGLLVANDGPFEEKDAAGLMAVGDTSKADDKASVGRFGLGQKAVFHLCDVFAFSGPRGCGLKQRDIFNPFHNLMDEGRRSAWEIGDDGWELLHRTADSMGLPTQRFLLWVPFRGPEDLKPFRGDGAITKHPPQPGDMLSDFGREEELLRLLPMLRNVRSIELRDGEALVLHAALQPDPICLLGADHPQLGNLPRRLRAEAACGQLTATARGLEWRPDVPELTSLKTHPAWPTRIVAVEGTVLEKADSHGATLLIRRAGTGLAVRWAVFLPISDESAETVPLAFGLDLILHGYFSLDSGRRAIRWSSSGAEPAVLNEQTLWQAWNARLRDQVTLPLLPELFHDALTNRVLKVDELPQAIAAIRATSLFKQHRRAICSKHGLARSRDSDGRTTWALLPADSNPLALPESWGGEGSALQSRFPELLRLGRPLILSPGHALLAEEPRWTPQLLARLLSSSPKDVLTSPAAARQMADLLELAAPEGGDPARASILTERLQHAFASEKPLPGDEMIRRLLRFVPASRRVSLRTDLIPELRRALASSGASALVIPNDLLPSDMPSEPVTDGDFSALLTALGPILRGDGKKDVTSRAGVIALELLQATGRRLEDLAKDPVLAPLTLCRVSRRGMGPDEVLDLASFMRLTDGGLIFQNAPTTNRFFTLLAEAVVEPRVFVLEVTHNGVPLRVLDAKAVQGVVAQAQGFGEPSARAELLKAIGLQDGTAVATLRRLAAGATDLSDQTRLLKLRSGDQPLRGLLIRLPDRTVHLLPTEVTKVLSDQECDKLRVTELSDQELERLLQQAGPAGLAEARPTKQECAAILARPLPEPLLRSLPLFWWEDGEGHPGATPTIADDPLLYQRNAADWQVPGLLLTRVRLLRNAGDPKAADAQQKLVQRWSPAAALHLLLDEQTSEHATHAMLEALHGLGKDKLDPCIARRLRSHRWLPTAESECSPDDILDLPKELDQAAREVLGDRATFSGPSALKTWVGEHLGFQRVQAELLPDRQMSLELLAVQVREAAISGLGGDADSFPMEDARWLAKQNVDVECAAWTLLRGALLEDGIESVWITQVLVPAFRAPTPTEAAALLANLGRMAAGHGKESEPARRLHLHVFTAICAASDRRSVRTVIGDLCLPAQDGRWHPARRLTLAASNVDPTHLLDGQWASLLEQYPMPSQDVADAQEPSSVPTAAIIAPAEEDAPAKLRKYFWSWSVPPGLLVAFIGLLGRTPPFRTLATERLGGEARSVDELWIKFDRALPSDVRRVDRKAEESLTPRMARRLTVLAIGEAGEVGAINLVGEAFWAKRATKFDSVLDPAKEVRPVAWARAPDGRERWPVNITMAPVKVAHLPLDEQARLLRNGIRGLLQDSFGLFNASWPPVESALDSLSGLSQESVETAVRTLQDELLPTLRGLKPAPGTTLRGMLDRLEEDCNDASRSGDDEALMRAKRKAWETLRSDDALGEALRESVAAQVRALGYGPHRVLFELFQNADDAVGQHPGAPRRVEVAFEGGLSLWHWGRPVNHPGAEPKDPRAAGYRRDLANMLRLNLSDKDARDTGKFGLGFKSVHLVSRCPSVASDLLAVRISAGMIPEDWPQGRVQVANRRDGETACPATVIELPHSGPADAAAQCEAFNTFRRAAEWLPVVAHHIRELRLTGPNEVVDVRTAWEAIAEISGLHVIKREIADREDRLLAFDLGTNYRLYLPLTKTGLGRLPDELPRLWHVAPLQDELASAWALSGPFRVDASRGSDTRTREELRGLAANLGLALGRLLRATFCASEQDWSRLATLLGLPADPGARECFWSDIFAAFAKDLSDPVWSALHAKGRGLGALAAHHAVLPPADREHRGLIALSEEPRVVHGVLEDPDIRAGLRGWAIAGRPPLVTPETSGIVSQLGLGKLMQHSLADLLRQECEKPVPLEAAEAARLWCFVHPALDSPNLAQWERDALADAARKARFLAADGSIRGTRELSIAPRTLHGTGFSGAEDEALHAAFAPSTATLAPSYETEAAIRFFLLARERAGYGRQARELAGWVRQVTDCQARFAVLVYLATGSQAASLGQELQPDIPDWLQHLEMGVEKLQGVSENARLMARLRLGLLTVNDIAAPQVFTDSQTADLEHIHAWWMQHRTVEVARFEGGDVGLYPAFFDARDLHPATPDEARRIAWFTLLTLTAMHSIGRTRQGQHRSFLQTAWQKGWWQELALSQPPPDSKPWLDRLESWSDATLNQEAFTLWRGLLPDLYAFARWLPEYEDMVGVLPELLKTDPNLTYHSFLQPNSFSALQGRGTHAAPLLSALGIGAPFLVRELTRHRVLSPANRLAPLCWMPTKRVRILLQGLGWSVRTERPYADLSRDIHAFVVGEIGEEAALFAGDFCLPLQLWTLRSTQDEDGSEE